MSAKEMTEGPTVITTFSWQECQSGMLPVSRLKYLHFSQIRLYQGGLQGGHYSHDLTLKYATFECRATRMCISIIYIDIMIDFSFKTTDR